MSRPLRIEFPGAYYHVMNRGLSYLPIFKTNQDRETFLELLGDVHTRWGFKIFSYCLMSNHYHLCVQTPEVSLARIMRHVDGVYTQRFNGRHRRDGPLFRGRYKAILIEKDRYLLAVTRYIHQNPVEADTVARPDRYRWSSLRYYIHNSARPAWLDIQTLLAFFNGKRKAFSAYMRSKPDAEVMEHYQSDRAAPVFGSAAFKDWVKSQFREKPMDQEIPERRHLAPDLDICLKAVSEVFEVNVTLLTRLRRGTRNLARQMAMHVCREMGGYSHREVALKLNAGSYSTVSSACAVMRDRLKTNRRLREQLQTIRERLFRNYGQQAT